MNLIRCLHITNPREAVRQMLEVGVDPTGIKMMEGKALHFNLRVEGIAPRTANLLKQEMLSLGGEAAVDRSGLDCSAKRADALLMGTQKQLEKLILKLDQYPDFQSLSQTLKVTLKTLQRPISPSGATREHSLLARGPS